MANKGNIKVIKDSEGGIVADLNTGQEIPFQQPYHKEFNLNVGDRVKFTVFNPPGAKTPVALNVERITVGTIKSINEDGVTGTLSEFSTDKPINFFAPLLKEQKLSVGDFVRYDLVHGPKGEVAGNLREIDR